MSYLRILRCDGCGREVDADIEHQKMHGWFSLSTIVDKHLPTTPVPEVDAHICSIACLQTFADHLANLEAEGALPMRTLLEVAAVPVSVKPAKGEVKDIKNVGQYL